MKRYVIAPRLRLEVFRDEAVVYRQVPLKSPSDVWKHLQPDVALWDRERFLVLALDSRHKTLGIEEVSVGSLNASLVHPREVFKALLLANSAAFILVHNHPSDDPNPSPEDQEITSRLKKAGEILGLALLDHVVVTSTGYYSFTENGIL